MVRIGIGRKGAYTIAPELEDKVDTFIVIVSIAFGAIAAIYAFFFFSATTIDVAIIGFGLIVMLTGSCMMNNRTLKLRCLRDLYAWLEEREKLNKNREVLGDTS